jgi:DNA (cytosine-5)-methyltransferase 1
MTHASLFSGIGGFDLAAEWIGWDNIFHCEWNPFGQKVLAHHFPNSKSYNDITKTDFSIHAGEIDVLTGGFPCQPYSSAGKRLGKADERHLFPHMLRCVKEVKPKYVIGENVRGLVNWNGGLVFHEVQDDLEREGYEVQSFLIPAAGVNAPHQRYRIWFVAFNSKSQRSASFREFCQGQNYESIGIRGDDKKNDASNTNKIRFSTEMENEKLGRDFGFAFSNKRDTWDSFPTQSPICGGNDGLPKELDFITFSKWKNESIKAYGNAIVPQVAYEIFKTIQSFEDMVNV